MAFDDLMKQVAVTLERDGSVRAVFGEALKLEHHTIVPVAVVSGGGGAGGTQGAQREETAGFAGGAGFAVNVRPVGFISEHGDEVTFTPIHVEGANKALVTEAALGVRKAIELVSGVITQFVRRQALKPLGALVPDRPPRGPGDGAAAHR